MFRRCPICENTKNEKIDKIKMILPKEYHLPNEYNVVACEKCGFCYADTSASLEDYNHYYGECNVYSGTPVGEAEWSYLHNTATTMLRENLEYNSGILDMGFGKGNFLRWLKKEGFSNIFGVDPSNDSVENIRKDGIEGFVGSVFDSPKDNLVGEFYCATLFDVLEHLLYPKEAIGNLDKYITENGYLLISVPNYNCLKYNNNPITNMFNQEHINYFSEQSLDNVMCYCGYKKISTNIDKIGEKEEIIALYKKSSSDSVAKYSRDELCKSEIKDYISKFTTRKNSINEKLDLLRNSKVNEVYVWGTGAFTMWLLANTGLSEFEIDFIDNNKLKKGQKFWKSEIGLPDDIKDCNRPIVICSMLYANAIKQQIEDMGLANEVLIV